MTRKATVTELRRHSRRLLTRVKAGEEVVITRRGVPVARLVGVLHGALKRGTGKLGRDFWRLPRPADPEGRVLAALIAERRGL